MIGLLSTNATVPVNMIQPVNLLHPLNRGLRAWWMALPGTQGGSRLMDITSPGPNGNHGTLTNMTSDDWVGSNRPGGWGALDFDGSDDEVALPSIQTVLNSGTTYGGPFSLSLWAKANVAPGLRYGVLSDGASNGNGGYFVIYEGGEARFSINGWNANIASLAITEVESNHIVCTWDGTTLSIYVNSIKGTDATDTTDFSTTEGNHFIGNAFGNREFDGQIDDVHIWDRFLLPAEVIQLFQLSQLGYPGMLHRIPRFAFSVDPVTGLFIPRMLISS